MKTLKARQKRFLKSNFHLCAPEIRIGKEGLSENNQKHLHSLLEQHEVIKVRINDSDFLSPKDVASEIKDIFDCNILRVIGKTILIYRESQSLKDERKIQLP